MKGKRIMKIVIDIPEEAYKNACGGKFNIPLFFEAVKKGKLIKPRRAVANNERRNV